MTKRIPLIAILITCLAGAAAGKVLIGVNTNSDPGEPIAPTEYSPPAAPANWAALISGRTVHTPDDSTELTSLLALETLDGDTLESGDVIALDADATYTGNFDFPDLGDSAWTYVVSDEYDSLPVSGTRATSAHTAAMAAVNVADTTPLRPAFGVVHEASKYRFIGIKSTTPSTGKEGYGMFQAGADTTALASRASTIAELPTDIIIDRCWFYGRDASGEDDRYGMWFNPNGGAVLDSTIELITGNQSDPIGIWAYMGSRIVLIQNCAVSASGENIILGGSDSTIAENELDWVIRGNHLFKLPKWFDNDPTYDSYNRIIKNHLEIKKGRRVLIENNIMEDCGDEDDGQRLVAIALTPRNQSGGDTFAAVLDVEIRYNIIRRVGVIVTLMNHDGSASENTERVWIHNNLAYSLNYYDQYGEADYPMFFIVSSAFGTGTGNDLRITHNTFVNGPNGYVEQYGNFLLFEQQIDGWDGLIVKDNIIECAHISERSAIYGGTSNVTTALNNSCVDYDVDNNLFFHEAADVQASYPGTNLFEADNTGVGFDNFAGDDYELTSLEYRAGQANDASDGEDMGADITEVLSRTSGVD